MVKVISLGRSELPSNERFYILIEWSDGECTSFEKTYRYLRYKIGAPKHRFWSTEAILLAARFGLTEIYYIGSPREVPFNAETRQYIPKPKKKSRRTKQAELIPQL